MAKTGAIRAGKAYVELGTDNKNLEKGLKSAQRRLREFGTAVRAAGMAFMKLGGLLAVPLIAGVKVFADFENQMANVSTMLSNSEEFMDRYRVGIRALAVEFGESTSTLAKGLYDILSASIDPAHAMDVLAVSVRAAKAGITDAGVAADAITTILNAYGMAASEAGRVSDIMFATVKRGKTTFAQLAPSIGMAISTAASAGVSLEEVGAILATLTRNGVQTENAVTALNQMILQFLKPSNEAVTTARQLGFEMNTATIQAEGLAGVFGRISKLKPEEIAKLFPNVRALRGVIPALRNMEGLTRDIALMANSAGMTEQAYQKMEATLSHVFGKLKAAAYDVLISIGQALAKPVGELAVSLKNMAQWISLVAGKNPELIRTVTKITIGILAAGAAMIALSYAVGALTTVLGILIPVVGVVESLLVAVFSPAGAIAVGIAAAGVGLFWLVGGFKYLSKAGQVLKSDMIGAFDGIKNALAAGDIGLAARIFWLTLKLEWQRGIGLLKDLWATLKFYMLTVMANVVDGIRAAWEIGVHAIKSSWDWLVGVLRDIWNSFSDWFKTSHDAATSWIAKRMIDVQGVVGAYTDEEVAQMKAGIDAKTAAYAAGVDEQRKLDDAAWEAKVKQDDEAHKRRLAAIGEENIATLDALKAEQLATIGATDDEIVKTRRELAEARRQTVEARRQMGIYPEAPGRPSMDVSGLQAGMADAVRRTIEVVGTFGAGRGLGVGPRLADERTAKGVEKLVEIDQDILDKMAGGITLG